MLSSFGLKFNSRRYNTDADIAAAVESLRALGSLAPLHGAASGLAAAAANLAARVAAPAAAAAATASATRGPSKAPSAPPPSATAAAWAAARLGLAGSPSPDARRAADALLLATAGLPFRVLPDLVVGPGAFRV